LCAFADSSSGWSTAAAEAIGAGIGGTIGGYFGLEFLVAVGVLVVLYSRHQTNLQRWQKRRTQATQGHAAAFSVDGNGS
jgi:hypothetical protein